MSATEPQRIDVSAELEALGMTEVDIDEMLEQQEATVVTLRGGLRSLWGQIDDDFEDRAVRRVRERLLDRETLSTLADLLGLGLQTGRVLMATEEELDG
ncbi:MAG: hypothetical protein OXG55_05560 [bacterium]|nr:hypothetical protein [bacterium]